MKTSDYLVTTLEEARKNGFLTKKDFALALTIIANSYAEDDPSWLNYLRYIECPSDEYVNVAEIGKENN